MRVRNENFTLNAGRTYVVIVLSALVYFILAYYTQRYYSSTLLILYSILFGGYLLIQRTELSINQLVFTGYFFRLIFLFAYPALSDDFYRFIWDGKLLAAGINPFSVLPSQLIEDPSVNILGIDHSLFEKLNSPEYFSVYPPVCQFIFWLSAEVAHNNILVNVILMRVFILAAEFGTIHLLLKLFKIYGFEEKYTAIYFLNPLVILELSGNIHFEALMIFFVLAAVLMMKKKKYVFSGILFGLAISTKLTPLILLPFIFRRIPIKDSLTVCLTAGVVAFLTFVPLLNVSFLEGFGSSLSLYFQKFEFNASVFYVIRELGLLVAGFDVIEIAGVILGVITFILIIYIAYKEQTQKNLLLGIFIWPLFIYYSLATIVHPWYITPIIAFSVFSHYRFPLVWSYFIFLTYMGYSDTMYNESLWVVFLEYIVVFAFMIYELTQKKNLVLK